MSGAFVEAALDLATACVLALLGEINRWRWFVVNRLRLFFVNDLLGHISDLLNLFELIFDFLLLFGILIDEAFQKLVHTISQLMSSRQNTSVPLLAIL